METNTMFDRVKKNFSKLGLDRLIGRAVIAGVAMIFMVILIRLIVAAVKVIPEALAIAMSPLSLLGALVSAVLWFGFELFASESTKKRVQRFCKELLYPEYEEKVSVQKATVTKSKELKPAWLESPQPHKKQLQEKLADQQPGEADEADETVSKPRSVQTTVRHRRSSRHLRA